jgi:hypothetical protein
MMAKIQLLMSPKYLIDLDSHRDIKLELCALFKVVFNARELTHGVQNVNSIYSAQRVKRISQCLGLQLSPLWYLNWIVRVITIPTYKCSDF